jgi:hypothetical protein
VLNLRTIAALTLSLTALAAHATDVDWGAHTALRGATFIHLAGQPSNSFTDTITFTLSSTRNVQSYVDPYYEEFNGDAVWDVGGTYGLYAADDTPIVEGWTFSQNHQRTLAAGTYYYKIAGFVAGSTGSSYSLSSNPVAVTAVPEPGTYALLMLGLGVVGYTARRQRAKRG